MLTNASKDILDHGLDYYFNSGVRFGFFHEDEDPKEIIDQVAKNAGNNAKGLFTSIKFFSTVLGIFSFLNKK